MKKIARIIKLSEGEKPESIRLFSDRVDARSLSESSAQRWVTVTRTGTFTDPRYGSFDITHDMLLSMVRNFKANTYGQQIVIDLSHKPQDGAAGFVRELNIEGDGNSYKLRALVEFTAFGIKAVKEKGFIYLSAEYSENFRDNEKGDSHGPTLLGAALTPRPVIKHLDPVQLAEKGLDGGPVLFSDRIIKYLTEETCVMWLKKLSEKLRKAGFSEAVIKKLCAQYEEQAKNLSEDSQHEALVNSIVTLAEENAEAIRASGNSPIQLSVTIPTAAESMDEEGVKRILAEAQATAKQDADNQAKKLSDNKALFTKLLDEAKLEGLTDTEKNIYLSAADMITVEMSEQQVTALANHQITAANQMAATKKLGAMGYQSPAVAGSVHITVDESNSIKQLHETVMQNLRGTSLHLTGQLKLSEKVHPFVDQVMGIFDQIHAKRLHEEAKVLAAGTTGMVDTSLPAGVQYAVIREALSDLRVLELVQALTDTKATVTTDIPYEERDVSGVYNDGIVFEGQPIHRASIGQKMDIAYILPMKLAFLISNEVMHFTIASQINWNAFARNVESNARFMRELIVRRLCNEMQRSADAYNATAVPNEVFDAQLDGSTVHTVKTTNYPIVRQHQQRDLQGNAVGSAENPITVRLNGTAISAYDGTGTQAAGTYYRITNYNLGYVQFVDETGTPVTPPNAAGADDISYSYSSNVVKFDLDNGSVDLEKHLNGLLRSIGAQKAMMKDDRFITPDFLLMSNTLNDTVTNADQFVASQKRDGTDTSSTGDLTGVKNISAWATNAPGVDLGDERILMGVRGTTTYTIAKPFVTGQPFEVTDATTGKPTGQKQAYGEEYSAIKTPNPIQNRYTSILAYSFTGR